MESIRQIATGILLGLISLALVIGGGILATSQNRNDPIISPATQLTIILPTLDPTNNTNSETSVKSTNQVMLVTPTLLIEMPTAENTPTPTITQLSTSIFPSLTNTLTIVPSKTSIPAVVLQPSNTPIIYQTLIPTVQLCGAPSDWINYFIVTGDTLFSISIKYQISISQLQLSNCLGLSENIYAGTYIKVPNVQPIIPYSTSTPYYYPSNTPDYSNPTLTPYPTSAPPDYEASPTPFSGIG